MDLVPVLDTTSTRKTKKLTGLIIHSRRAVIGGLISEPVTQGENPSLPDTVEMGGMGLANHRVVQEAVILTVTAE